MCECEKKKYYKVRDAQIVYYTDPTGKIVTRNIVRLDNDVVYTFEYPQCGYLAMLIRKGSQVQFAGAPGVSDVISV